MQNDNGRMRFGVELDTAKLRADAMESQRILNSIGKTAVENGDRMDEMLKKVGKGFASIVSIGAFAQLAKQIVAVRGEIQSLEVAFNTLTGSAEVGGKLLADIRQFAVSTPMQMNDLAKGAQTLLAFNTAAEDVMPILKAIGDISMGDAAKFQSLTLAFSQMSAAGKLMGQDRMQMINAGFNPLSVIAEKTGKSLGELNDEMSKGAISAEMVKQAFMDATSEGGKFYGMLESQSHTLNGAISNLQGAIQDTFNSIGEASEGAIAGAVDVVTKLVKNYEELGSVLMGIVSTYGAYKAAVMTTTTVTNVQTAAAHYEEAKALEALMTVEQREELVKRGLKATDEAYLVEAKKMVAANVKEAESALQRARAEVSASAHALNARRAEYMQAKEIVAAKKLELEAAIESGEAKKIEAAQTALNTAEERKNAAAKTFQAAAADKNAKQTAVETAAKAANSAQTAANTAAQTANASATNVLAIAKAKLVKALNKVKAALAANPYAAAAAAITALAYGIYKLATYETQAEKAHKEFVKTVNEGKQAVDAEAIKVDKLFDNLKKAKEGTDEWKEAREKVMNQYGSYLQKLGNELTTVEDIAAAHIKVKNAILEEARAKQYANAIEQAANNASAEQARVFEKLREEIDKTDLSKGKKDEFFNAIKIQLLQYGETQNQVFYETALKNYRKIIKDDAFSVAYGSVANYDPKVFVDFKKSVEQLQNDMKAADTAFGGSAKKTEEAAAEETKTIQQLRDEFDKLSSAEQTTSNDTYASIKQREKELKGYKELGEQIEWLQKVQKSSNDNEVVKDAEKRIEALKKQQDAITGKGTAAKAEDEAEKKRLAAQKLQKEIEDYYKEVEDAERDGALELEQQRINLLEDGYEKEEAQIALDYEKRKLSIKQLEKRYIEDLIEVRKKEWQKANPNAKESEWVRPTLSRADLSAGQQNQLSQMEELNERAKAERTKKLLDGLLREYEDFEQGRNRIIKDFAEKRKALYDDDGKTLKNGVSQSVVDNMKKAEKEALEQLAVSYASKDSGFRKWRNALYGKTIDELKKMLAEAQSALSNDPNSAILLAKVYEINKQLENIDETQKNVTSDERLGKLYGEWREVASAIGDANNAILDLVSSLADVDDGLMNIVATISTTLVSTAEQSLQKVQDAISIAAKQAKQKQEGTYDERTGKIENIMQSASVWMMIIKAVYTIISSVLEIGKKWENEYYGQLSGLIDRLNSFINNPALRVYSEDVMRVVEGRLGARGVWGTDRDGNPTEYHSYADSLSTYIDEFFSSKQKASSFSEWWKNLFKRNIFYAEEFRKKLQEITTELVGMRYGAGRNTGSSQYDLSNVFDVYQEKLAALAEQIDILMKKPRKNAEQIEELEQQMEDTFVEMAQVIDNALDDIIGGSAADIASQLGDAFVEAFRAGENAAQRWGDTVKDIVGDIAKNMIVKYLLEDQITAIFDKYKQQWFAQYNTYILDQSDRLIRTYGVGDLVWENLFATLPDLGADLTSLYEQFQQQFDSLRDSYPELYEMLMGSSSSREAASKGIATASQETVDELNGRITAVQGHTYQINETTKLMLLNTNAILLSVQAIEHNTDRLISMEGDLGSVRNDLNYIRTHGVTIN